MKNITLIIGLVLFFQNMALCVLFDSISAKTTIVSSVVILVSTLLSHVSSQLHFQDAFKISLPWVFFSIGAIQYVFAFFIGTRVAKLSILVIIVLFAFESILLIITNTFSKRTMHNNTSVS